jgi:signal transduction histidine kinase
MDGLADCGHYRCVRRLSIWSLLAVVSAAYLAVVSWRLSAGPVDLPDLIWMFLGVPPMAVCGALLMLKRPEHPIGELLLLTGIAFPLVPTILEIPTDAIFQHSGAQEWMWASMWLERTSTSLGVVLAVILLVLLPDGRLRYPRERPFVALAWIVVVFPTLDMFANQFMVSPRSFPGVIGGIPSPLFVESLAPWGPILAPLSTLSYAVVFSGGIALLFMRYRAAPTHERKQIRWVLFAGAVAILVALLPSTLADLGVIPPIEGGSALVWTLVLLPFLLFPASVVVAVMEPPWIDVDIVIRRSLVYGALSIGILLVYVVVAAWLGMAAGTQLGLGVEVAVVLAVLIALLFEPARRRLQDLADRWLFGARPSKYEAVTEFGVTVEQAAEPSQLLPPLVETIRTTLRLAWAMASLDDGTSAAMGSASGKPAVVVPIAAGTEQVGEILCGPKSQGTLRDDEIQLVRTLAGQLGLAVMNARLAGRIVNAAEAERRRIEQNIHDGAQQELVALVAKLAMARSATVQGALTPDVIDDLRLEAQQILSDLRELAQGIHPSVLSDGGIVEAVEDRCARLPIDVSLQSSESLRTRRFDDNTEGAAYFFVTESLTNVLKHANASRAEISMTYGDGRLRLEVTDDGRGFEPDRASNNGLAGLQDRIRALGGTVTIASGPGRGTSIAASLPVADS